MGPFLGSVLPGLRELRAPLAAGYLWIAIGWLLLRDRVTGPARAAGLLKDVYDVAAWLGKPGLLVVSGFVAYLVGIVSTASSSAVIGLLARLTAAPAGNPRLRAMGLGGKGFRAVRALCAETVTRLLENRDSHTPVLSAHPQARALALAIASNAPLGARRRMVETHVELDRYLEALAEDFSAVPVRLMLNKPEAYAAYDRARAEGEYRAAVALPLLAASIVLVPVALPVALGVAAVATIVGYQGLRKLVESNDELAEILRADDGRDSPATATIAPLTITFSDPSLTPDEVRLIEGLADAAEPSQPQLAISYYEILAATGSREHHEKLCDLSRDHQPELLLGRLGEGAQVSGRLAAEFVREVAARSDLSADPEARRSVARGLIWGVRDPEWASACRDAMVTATLGEHVAEADRNDLSGLLQRACRSNAALEEFLRTWQPQPDGLRDVAARVPVPADLPGPPDAPSHLGGARELVR